MTGIQVQKNDKHLTHTMRTYNNKQKKKTHQFPSAELLFEEFISSTANSSSIARWRSFISLRNRIKQITSESIQLTEAN